jgi:hypothetical protein
MSGMNGRMRAVAYRLCKKRSGEICACCGRKGNPKTLLVAHKDDSTLNLGTNKNPVDGRNWELRCRPCAYTASPRNCKPVKRYRSFSSIGEMIGYMVDTIYARRNPGLPARRSVADRLTISEIIFDQMIKGEAMCSVQQFCNIARLCKCNNVAFDWLKEYGV